jgi:hypothetical protein
MRIGREEQIHRLILPRDADIVRLRHDAPPPDYQTPYSRRLPRSFDRALDKATVATDKQVYQHQIQAIDRQIDVLVYELYGLTEEEIEIVEGATG